VGFTRAEASRLSVSRFTLPEPLRRSTLAKRTAQLLRRRASRRPEYSFESDGLATAHYSPFLTDEKFNASYAELRKEWFPDAQVDVRWRMWLLTRLANHCTRVDGDFAEFGVYRAGCAFMILQGGALPEPKRFFLFDTFAGVPEAGLSASEVEAGIAGAHADTSVEYVRQRLAPWNKRLVLVPGDVHETLRESPVDRLAFVHMDLNAAKPTKAALEYAYPRLSQGAIVLFDDYGWAGLEAQRDVIDEFLQARPDTLIALPTGQALLVRQ
jgi:O-methyltransferase